jgi:hypothetical protein
MQIRGIIPPVATPMLANEESRDTRLTAAGWGIQWLGSIRWG